jgi:hypothetical protein
MSSTPASRGYPEVDRSCVVAPSATVLQPAMGRVFEREPPCQGVLNSMSAGTLCAPQLGVVVFARNYSPVVAQR